MEVLYEDNHVIIVNKAAGEIVQGDKTGDRTLADEVKAYIKQKYNKPGEVFLGTVHRLDRPVSGLVVFARTSKALTRLNEMFRRGDVHKMPSSLSFPSVPTALGPHKWEILLLSPTFSRAMKSAIKPLHIIMKSPVPSEQCWIWAY